MSFTKNQLLPDEKLVVLVHQHMIVLLKSILVNVLGILLLVAAAYYFTAYWLMLLCLVPVLALLWVLLARHKREYIVTDRRVVKQEGIVSVSSFDAPLDKINNVFHEQNILGRLLNYGTVGLETASEQGTTIFDYIPNPVKFKNCVVMQRESYRAPGQSQPAAAGENLPRLLEDLASLRDRKIITPQEFEAKKKALLEKM